VLTVWGGATLEVARSRISCGQSYSMVWYCGPCFADAPGLEELIHTTKTSGAAHSGSTTTRVILLPSLFREVSPPRPALPKNESSFFVLVFALRERCFGCFLVIVFALVFRIVFSEDTAAMDRCSLDDGGAPTTNDCPDLRWTRSFGCYYS
jgi:hypothetical protein